MNSLVFRSEYWRFVIKAKSKNEFHTVAELRLIQWCWYCWSEPVLPVHIRSISYKFQISFDYVKWLFTARIISREIRHNLKKIVFDHHLIFIRFEHLEYCTNIQYGRHVFIADQHIRLINYCFYEMFDNGMCYGNLTNPEFGRKNNILADKKICSDREPLFYLILMYHYLYGIHTPSHHLLIQCSKC